MLELAVSDSTLAVDSEGRVMVPSTQTMVWARLQPLRLGIGVEQQRLPGGPARLTGADPAPRGSARLTMGVSVKAGASSRLSWQTQWPQSRAADDDGLGAEQRPGWSLRQRDPVATLRAGSLFKAQLGDQTVVTLRPRRGQAVVTLQHRW